MTYSLPFQLQNGHIYGVFPNTMEREDILNVKRGILSAMQVSIVGKDNIWEVEEVKGESVSLPYQLIPSLLIICFMPPC